MKQLFNKKNLMAIGFGLLLLLFIEVALRMFGVPLISDEDPFVGFHGSVPVFIEQTPGHFSLNPAKEEYFNPQKYRMPKPQGGFRIVSLGGSTTYGRPFYNQTSFPSWLQKLLSRYGANPQIESLNLGGISYASYRVRRVLEELLTKDPDLVVIYSGHNEFLENRTFADIREEPESLRTIRGLLHRSAGYSLLYRSFQDAGLISPRKAMLGENVDATLEQVGGPELYHRDAQFRDRVIAQYQHEIRRMVRLCREYEVPVVLCTTPSNLSGLSPFKSEHRDDINAEQLRLWETFFAQGESARLAGRWEEALSSYRQALTIDSQYALLQYRRAQALEALGRYPEASAAYMQAKELDIVPLRSLDRFNDFLRRFSEEENIPLADVELVFKRISPNGIPGASLFEDHVHPSIEGQQLIAWVVLSAATKASMVPLDAQRWRSLMPEAKEYLEKEYAKIPEQYRVLGKWGVGRLFYWAGKYDAAEKPLYEAWQVIKDLPEIPVQLGNLALRLKDASKAITYFDAALQIDPQSVEAYMGRAKAFISLGNYNSALKVVQEHNWPEKLAVEALVVEGQALVSLGEFVPGITVLTKAEQLAPGLAKVQLTLAIAFAKVGRNDAAEKSYRHYLLIEGYRSADIESAVSEWKSQILAE
ncbi:MAG: hypothetical protein C0623_08030 [Desulfuromonas sp.]|nr:MAG: hypothetical protein C0623_08030 [Desulfuromonas sp.]